MMSVLDVGKDSWLVHTSTRFRRRTVENVPPLSIDFLLVGCLVRGLDRGLGYQGCEA